MKAQITNKLNGSTQSSTSRIILLSEPSVVHLPISPRNVTDYQRHGNDLTIHLQNGQVIKIVNFYVHFVKGQENTLVLEDDDGKLWAGSHSDGLADFNFTEIQSVDQLVGSSGGFSPILLGLGALGLAGIGIAAASSGGGGGDSNNEDGSGGNSGGVDDTTAPAAPGNLAIDADGTTVTGTGEPGASVIVTGPDGTVIGEGTVDDDGNFVVELDTPQTNGEDLEVALEDAAGNDSPSGNVTAPDTTEPAAPTVTVGTDGVTLTITGEPNATATVYDAAGNPLGTVVLDDAGSGTYTVPESNGQDVTVSQTDAAGNEGPTAPVTLPDTLDPVTPTVAVGTDGVTLTITGEPNATATVYDAAGNPLGTVVLDDAGSGTYTVPESNGQDVTVSQTDAAGNEGPTAPVTLPDTLDPVAPTVAVGTDGVTLTITGEPNATATVYDAAGNPLGTVVLDDAGSGTYTVPESNGQDVTVSQTDAAGNEGPTAPVTLPDTLDPVTPTVAVGTDGVTLTITGEPNATATIYDTAGNPLGTVVLDDAGSGTYTVPESNGQDVTVSQTDAAGNEGPTAPVALPDTLDPVTPTVAVGTDGVTLTITGEPNATATVYDAAGNPLGTVVLDDAGSGTYAVPESNGQDVTVSQTDAAGNEGPTAPVTLPDTLDPVAPTVAVGTDGVTLTITGEPNATATVYDAAGNPLGTVVLDDAGSGTYTVPESNGQDVTVSQTDAAGNEGPTAPVTLPDTLDPVTPTVAVGTDGVTLTITGEPNATATVYDAAGNPLGTVVLDDAGSGTYTVPESNGQDVTVSQTDAAGNEGPTAPVTLPDTLDPVAPTVAVGTDGVTLTITGEPNATATVYDAAGNPLGTVVLDDAGSGTYAVPESNGQDVTVSQTDAAGNEGPTAPVTLPDTLDPVTPTVAVGTDGVTLTITGEPNGTATIYDTAGNPLGTVVLDDAGSGTYAVPESNGQDVTVSQTDAAGNEGPTAPVTLPDTLDPVAPTVAVGTDGVTLTITGEPNATATVYDTAGNPLGTVVLDDAGSGTYAVPESNGQDVTVSQTDAAGNEGPTAPVTLPDTLDPVTPTVAVGTDGVTLTITGEPNATATVYDAAGNPLGTVVLDDAGSGTYTVPESNGQDVTVSQTDAAGNEGPTAPVTLPDTLDPVTPTVAVGTDGVTLTITGEPNATATVYDAAGNPLGTVVLDDAGSGTYTVPESNGQDVTVSQTDAAGNEGPTASATLPDTLDPVAPTVTLEADTGTDGDGITSDGAIVVDGLETGATWEYTTNGGTSWQAGSGTSFELGVGTYADGAVQVRQTDATGNVSLTGTPGAVTITGIIANDDSASVDLGGRTSVTNSPVTDENLQVLGVADTDYATNAIPITVDAGFTGDVVIEVSQTALLAVADAFNVEIYDADGNRVYVGTTSGDDPLVGDVAGIEILGVTGDNELVAQVTGLAPGDYTVIVRKGESALGTLLDADGDGVSLEELGQGGVVLGEENQELVLDAVETALNDQVVVPVLDLGLGTFVRNILEPVLDTTTALGAGEVVQVVSDGLAALGLTQYLDLVLGTIADELLSNTLTLIQDTSVTVTLTEHGYENADIPVTGNVIDPDIDVEGETGEDDTVPGSVVTQIENSDGDIMAVGAGGSTIEGLYGTLLINPDGSYTYTPNGTPESVGQTETFTYTVSDGNLSDEATLTFTIDGEKLTDDTAQAGIEYNYDVTDGMNDPDAVSYSWTGIALGLPIGTTGSLTGDSFVVDAGTTQDVTLTVDTGSLLGLGAGVTVYVEVLNGSTWTTYASYDNSSLLSLLGSGGAGEILIPDLAAGEYRVRADLSFSLISVAGGVTIGVESEVTHLDVHVLGDTFEANGDLFANDVLDASHGPLSVSSDGTTFTEVLAGVSITVDGLYGSLLINGDGTYTYTPEARIESQQAVTGEYTDTFYYRVDGEEATLVVTIDGGMQGEEAAPAPVGFMAFSMFEADVVPLIELDNTGSPDNGEGTSSEVSGESILLEPETSELTFVSTESEEPIATSPTPSPSSTTKTDVSSTTPDDVSLANDTLSYLATNPLTQEDQLNQTSAY